MRLETAGFKLATHAEIADLALRRKTQRDVRLARKA